MRIKIVLMSVYMSLFLCLSTLVAQAFQQTDVLERSVGPLRIKGETIDRVLETISADYKIPMGIELIDAKKYPAQTIDVNLPKMVLRSALDYLVMQDPRYGWKVEGQVIHFSPVKDRDNLLATLLDTKLNRVSFSSELRLSDMKYGILNLPEIQAKLVEAQVEPLMFEIGIRSREKLGISLDYSNLTLRDLLNRITLNTSRQFWVLLRWWHNNEYIALRL